MIPITTKLLRKRWFCFATFDGYDYSYTGKTMEEAQNKMKARLKKNDLEGHGLFMNVHEIPQPQGFEPIRATNSELFSESKPQEIPWEDFLKLQNKGD